MSFRLCPAPGQVSVPELPTQTAPAHIQILGNNHFMRNLSSSSLSICASLVLLLLAGCAQRGVRATSASTSPVNVQLPEGGPTLLAAYQPWFGNPSHIDVGYSSHDPNVLRSQIARAREMNISGLWSIGMVRVRNLTI